MQAPGHLVGGQVDAGDRGIRVGVAQDPLAVGEGAPVQRDGLVQSPGHPIGVGQVVAAGQGVGGGCRPRPARTQRRSASGSRIHCCCLASLRGHGVQYKAHIRRGAREACQVTVGEELVTVGCVESPAGLVFRICQNHPRGLVRLLVPPRITLRGGDTITRRSPY